MEHGGLAVSGLTRLEGRGRGRVDALAAERGSGARTMRRIALLSSPCSRKCRTRIPCWRASCGARRATCSHHLKRDLGDGPGSRTTHKAGASIFTIPCGICSGSMRAHIASIHARRHVLRAPRLDTQGHARTCGRAHRWPGVDFGAGHNRYEGPVDASPLGAYRRSSATPDSTGLRTNCVLTTGSGQRSAESRSRGALRHDCPAPTRALRRALQLPRSDSCAQRRRGRGAVVHRRLTRGQHGRGNSTGWPGGHNATQASGTPGRATAPGYPNAPT